MKPFNGKIKVVAVMAVVMMCSSASVCWGQSKVTEAIKTVDQLLEIDAKQALIKAQDDAAKSGLLGPPSGKGSVVVAKPKPPKWTVKSIYGVGNNVSADIVVGQHEANGARAGTTIQNCVVTHIQGTCVFFEPQQSTQVKKGRLAKKPNAACPSSACWTGYEIAMEANPPQVQSGTATATPGSPLPPGMPIGAR